MNIGGHNNFFHIYIPTKQTINYLSVSLVVLGIEPGSASPARANCALGQTGSGQEGPKKRFGHAMPVQKSRNSRPT